MKPWAGMAVRDVSRRTRRRSISCSHTWWSGSGKMNAGGVAPNRAKGCMSAAHVPSGPFVNTPVLSATVEVRATVRPADEKAGLDGICFQ